MISFSQNSTKKIYHTEKLLNNSSIIIDGYLNDSSWGLVPWGNDFIEVYPDENTSPTEETKFKILYDEKYIYIALLALDSNPSTITNRLSRRDGFEGDRINVPQGHNIYAHHRGHMSVSFRHLDFYQIHTLSQPKLTLLILQFQFRV